MRAILSAFAVLSIYALASGMSFEDAKARESRWCDMVEAEVWGASEAEYKRRCL